MIGLPIDVVEVWEPTITEEVTVCPHPAAAIDSIMTASCLGFVSILLL